MTTNVTQELVHEFLDYNPTTGVFTWKHRDPKWFKTPKAAKIWNTRYVGKQAGYTSKLGYVQIAIFDVLYLAHKLAHLYMSGSFPASEIDHIDRDPSNNAWDNLRVVDRSHNLHNTKAKGYHYCPDRKKYYARLTVDRVCHSLGGYVDEADAKDAYLKAKEQFGFLCPT